MARSLFVDDRAEIWQTRNECAARPLLKDICGAMQGWGLALNWDKTQLLARPMGAGCITAVFYFEGRLVHTQPVAKYLGARIAATGAHTPEVRRRVS